MCSVWLSKHRAKEKAGTGEQKLPGMALSLGKQEGAMKNVRTASSRAQTQEFL